MHQLFKKAFSTNNCQFEHKPFPKRPSSKNSTPNNPIELSHTNPPPNGPETQKATSFSVFNPPKLYTYPIMDRKRDTSRSESDKTARKRN